ncbi:MAG: hypothetical protein NZ576_05170 [Bacteroidia bacterium]|nr:hypothetical protein [Bacteroidia bacterium]
MNNHYLVVDCGSTKADWRVFDTTQVVEGVGSVGFNPSIEKPEDIKEIIALRVVPKFQKYTLNQIFFYGAGCSSASIQHFMQILLHEIFQTPVSQIYVAEDLMGAVYATAEERAGIVAILSTGSNSCYFENGKIVEQWGGNGYLLGDEGSGADMGKRLLKGLLDKKFPSEIERELQNYTQLPLKELRQAVYAHKTPNRFLGSLSYFIFQLQTHPTIKQLIRNAFEDFLKTALLNYKQHAEVPTYFIGSIAWYFQAHLLEVLQEYNYPPPRKIIHKPIEELVAFHQKQFQMNRKLV